MHQLTQISHSCCQWLDQ